MSEPVKVPLKMAASFSTKYLHAGTFEGVDHARTEEFDLIARVGILRIGASQLFALGFVEKAEVKLRWFRRWRVAGACGRLRYP